MSPLLSHSCSRTQRQKEKWKKGGTIELCIPGQGNATYYRYHYFTEDKGRVPVLESGLTTHAVGDDRRVTKVSRYTVRRKLE